MKILCNQTQQKNTPSFKADIHVITSAEMRMKRFFNAHYNMPTSWNVEESVNLANQCIFSEEAFHCSIGVITNPEAKMANMDHIWPDDDCIKNIDEVGQTIYDWAKELFLETKTRLQGLIIGGKSPIKVPDDPDYKNSLLLHDKLKETYEKISKDFGMDYSVLGIQKKHKTSSVLVFTDPKINTHYVVIRDAKKSYTNVRDVYKFFSDIKISPNDRFIFNGVDKTEELHKMVNYRNSRKNR